MHQVWDRRVDAEPLIYAFSFDAHFSDSHSIEIVVNPEFGSEDAARSEAGQYMVAIGQLPRSLRDGINRFSIHQGDEGFHAGAGQVVVYAGTSRARTAAHHLEESLFHESVHAAWDDKFRQAQDWVKAQAADGRFLTKYGLDIADREDLAETALFAYALFRHPGRIPPVDTNDIVKAIPHRLAFLNRLLEADASAANARQTEKTVCP